ncbi:MAG TPA: response regulator [Actinomycetota bacterium]|nr:response regulator [Actinomycetota bacterium]
MKVLLVDDHSSIRRSLRQLIELNDHFEVVGEGANGREALERVEELRPDIIMMDMNMPVMNGVEATKAIKSRHPDVKVLALTAFADMSLVSSMVRAGASGYLLKGGSATELLEALDAVARGRGALDKEVTKGVMEDVAELYRKEQERADALAELDRMKSEFVSVVSHELRTPLTSIKGGVSTLRHGWDSIGEQTKFEFLDSISKQCDRLDRMVTQILTVSGIQRGGLGLHPSTFSLAAVAREAIDSLGVKTAGRQIVLDADPTVQAAGDHNRITEVACALIENALVFTSGRVAVSVTRAEGIARLAVADEGPGLDASTLARLLDNPFTQADSSSTRVVGGLGLSLYIAKQVLEASGGRLEVDTGPGRGATFTLALPQPSGPAEE